MPRSASLPALAPTDACSPPTIPWSPCRAATPWSRWSRRACASTVPGKSPWPSMPSSPRRTSTCPAWAQAMRPRPSSASLPSATRWPLPAALMPASCVPTTASACRPPPSAATAPRRPRPWQKWASAWAMASTAFCCPAARPGLPAQTGACPRSCWHAAASTCPCRAPGCARTAASPSPAWRQALPPPRRACSPAATSSPSKGKARPATWTALPPPRCAPVPTPAAPTCWRWTWARPPR